MNAGTWVAIHAATTAAAAAKARTHALDCFRTRDATAPERARTLREIGLADDDRAVGELISAGIVRGVDSRGRLTVLGDAVDRVEGYYLDEAAFIAHRDGKTGASSRSTALAVAIAVLLVVAGAVAVVVMAVNR
jgi:hypothetical protein